MGSNFVSVSELMHAAYFHSRRLARLFPSAFRFTQPHYHNAVGAFMRRPSDPVVLRRHLVATPGLNPDLKSSGLRFRVERLRPRQPGQQQQYDEWQHERDATCLPE